MLVGYFKGVRLGLGDPRDVAGERGYDGSRLRVMYLDVLDEYAFFFSKKRDMVFHNYMMELIISWFGLVPNLKIYSSGDNPPVPDFEINHVFFEVESGLKHDLKPLISRLRKYPNFFYVVVPNASVKARYRAELPVFHGRLLTLKELKGYVDSGISLF